MCIESHLKKFLMEGWRICKPEVELKSYTGSLKVAQIVTKNIIGQFRICTAITLAPRHKYV